MLRWLRPPQIEDEFERVAYHSLHYTLLLALFIGIFAAFPPKGVSQAIINTTAWSVMVLCYILLQKGHLHLSGTIFLSSTWLFITLNVVDLNGINNSAIFGYVIIIIFANVIFARRRIVLIFTLLSMLSCVVLTIGEVQGILPLRSTPRSAIFVKRFLAAIAVFGATGILSSFSLSVLRRSLTRLQQNESVLQVHNRELETLAHNLAASEKRYRLLFDNASIMAAVYDSNGQIILVNDAAAKMAGKGRSEMEGRNIQEVFLPGQAKTLAQACRAALTSGEVVTTEGNDTLPNGTPVYYLRHVIPLPADISDKPQILVLTTDLTERKRDLERQQELQAAQERLMFFNEFFGRVSHDMKTPLAVMETSLHLLEHASDDSYRENKITQLRQQIFLLERYIQDMLMVSRLDHVPTLTKEAVDVNALTADIIQSLDPKLEQKNIQCEIEYQDAPVVISADKEQMRRALTNLIENAINYTATGGQIHVVILRQNGSVIIDISDTGIGIQAEDIPHVFDAFFRAPEAKTVMSTGSGLGLALVKKIIDLHGGTISVTSQPLQGSSFLLTLPAQQTQIEA